ncbi:MAG: exo-alpha-sialidase [Chloroflexi bacterium]|nr:exo-alpha-sialidase [Chloroflexota bacterium]MCI0574992.1 exo-alpha-sialidase [Chloroflexota bacterium]MCI0645780.1 exo-alpha-sialidase [Chloroflexota bacterium]MCI0727707.1 exo-alpha-sialidase [Chloroflexota bacterium]
MLKVAYKLTIGILGLILLAGIAFWVFPGATVVAQEDQFLPTAEPCGAPTIQSSAGPVNVRSGPGVDYEVIGVLAFLEVRPIAGRAGSAEWWQVQMADGSLGWVANNAVNVQGDTTEVPVVEAPLLAGEEAPTPGPTWNPTPNPLCPTPVASVVTATPGAATDPPVETNTWTTPINLSLSGASNEPQVVVDANGQFHIIWKDDVEGFVYVAGDGQEWSIPAAVETPFGTRRYYPDLKEDDPTPLFVPHLVADPTGRIHAFWIDEELKIYYSSVDAADFANFSAWSSRQNLAESALQLDVVIAAGEPLHLAYVRPLDTAEAPAGIYYRQLASGESEWSTPAQIYQSRYFRSLAQDQAHVRIIATRSGEADQVLIAWDNRPLGRVLVARSGDGGQSWGEPFQVDGREPEDTAEAANPGNIAVGALGDNAVLVWRAGHDEATCSEYYRQSTDGGLTWGERLRFDTPRGCHDTDQFLVSPDGLLVLLALVDEITEKKVYLLAWNGEAWSEPQEQALLSGFENQETYLEVTYQCHQASLLESNTLFVVGCDAAAGKDIWLTSRPLGRPVDWFPPPPTWQPPVLIGAGPNTVPSLDLVADADGLLHAFWVQNEGAAITYASRDNLRWSQPTEVLRALQGGSGQPAATVDGQGHLLVVWSGTVSGQIYFSWAEAARALTPSDWTLAQVISEPGLVAQSPDIVVSPRGTIYVSYVVPLNEGRGIYLVYSQDGGSTWSPTVTVFDGVAADWAMVDRPRLAMTGNGDLHLVWARYQAPFNGEPLAFFYARSEDQGQNWSEPELVAEKPASWSEVVAFGERSLHRLWLNGNNDTLALWYQLSQDSGHTWTTAASATGFGQPGGPIWLTLDSAGRLHLLGAKGNVLQHWMWENGKWVIGEEAALTTDPASDVYALAAAIAANGNVAVVYAATGAEENTLSYTGRLLELPAMMPTPLPTLTPTPRPTSTVTPTPLPTPSPTVALPTEAAPSGSPVRRALGGDNSLVSLALSFIPAILVVAVAFLLGMRALRLGRR